MEIKPILDSDKDAVSLFLHNNLFKKISVDEWNSGLFPRWSQGFPNHGHMMVEDGEIVGCQIVIYSKMLYNGYETIFGNLSSWCVLEEYRKGLNSILLLRKNVSDKNVNYTVTTPNDIAQNIFSKFGFETIDNGIYLIPNLPVPFSSKTIVSDTQRIPSLLDERNLRVFNDHKYIPWLKHLVISGPQGTCYVIYRDWRTRRSKHLKNSRVLYISNEEVFSRHLSSLRGFFLTRGFAGITINSRFLKKRPFFSFSRPGSKPVCYRGAEAPSEAFTNAYTQVMTFEAHY